MPAMRSGWFGQPEPGARAARGHTPDQPSGGYYRLGDAHDG